MRLVHSNVSGYNFLEELSFDDVFQLAQDLGVGFPYSHIHEQTIQKISSFSVARFYIMYQVSGGLRDALCKSYKRT